ncbi:MAG: M20/M25/M40 family metallo-hydrolase [Pelosinus sp.]|nr:M20/M25/M40 family metallo-hydrolase [Pelosinus sp.]
MINKQRMLAEFFELVQISCPSKEERQAADMLKHKLAELGLEVSEDEAGSQFGGTSGNIFGFMAGSLPNAPVIMLSAHMDCVEPCSNIKPVLANGVITAQGDTILGGDDKAGISAILEGLRVIKENNISHGGILTVFTICEESGLGGSRHIDRNKLSKADFGYALDAGGSPGEIVNMAPGQNSITVKVAGKTAHAGLAPEEGNNAIVLAAKAIARVKQGRIDEETTANVGIIKGGVATNIVPDKVKIFCEARSRSLPKLEAQTKHMKETFEQVVSENGGKAEVIVKEAYQPFVLSRDAAVIKLAEAAAKSLGLTVNIGATGGGSDANFFNSFGMPTAVLGVGMSKVHTTEEFLKEEDLYNSAEWIVAIIKTAAAIKK